MRIAKEEKTFLQVMLKLSNAFVGMRMICKIYTQHVAF